MRSVRTYLLAVGLVSIGAATVVAQTPIGSLDDEAIEIRGVVADVFGNEFVLEDDSGRVLVETGPAWYHEPAVAEGDMVSVVGAPDDGSFSAYRLLLADGSELRIRSADGPPPWAGGRKKSRADASDGTRGAD